MEKRTLGRTELRLSEVALGTWGLASRSYGEVTEQAFEETVAAALDAGINTFDLSPHWGEGAAEKIVGKVVGAGRRDDVVYITRAGADPGAGGILHRLEPDDLRASCEASLARLGTDRIELLLLQDPPEKHFARHEWLDLLEALKQEGKIRAWGASVGDAETARKAISAGAQALCVVYNALRSDDLHELTPDVTIAGAGVIARSPLAYGLLSGSIAADRTFDETDHRRKRWTADLLRKRVKQVEELRFLVHDGVKDLAAAAIRFVLANAVVTTAAVGARTPEQIREAAAAASGPPYLPEDDVVRLYQVLAATGG